MKKRFAALFTAILVLGATTTVFAEPSITTGDLSEAAGNVTSVGEMTDEQIADVIEAVAIESSAITTEEGATYTVTVDNSKVTANVFSAAAEEAVDAVKDKYGVDVTEEVGEKETKVTAAIVAVVDVALSNHTPGEEVSLTFSVDSVKAGESIIILHEKSAGVWERITPDAVADGKVTATFTSFSPIAIVKVAATTEKTGVTLSLLPLAAIACAAGAVVCGKKSK